MAGGSFNMLRKSIIPTVYFPAVLLLFCIGCGEKQVPKEKDIVQQTELMDDRIRTNVRQVLDFASINTGRINDSILLQQYTLIQPLYNKNDFAPFWSTDGVWLREADSLIAFIKDSKHYGLFPTDYHFRALSAIRERLITDTLAQKDAVVWTRADLMMTDAFMILAKHLKQGRLEYDSITLRRDTLLPVDFYTRVFELFRNTKNASFVFRQIEPKHEQYTGLKKALAGFLDTTEFRRTTWLTYPYKDSLAFYRTLQMRLFEENLLMSATTPPDTATLRGALRKFQASKNLKITGRINEATVSALNNTEWEQFKKIAINLDRFKLLPDSLPPVYVWVNIPSYYLRLIDTDSVVLTSRVIVGASKTRTPVLNSDIANFITYPQWTVPYSIIFKEMLPQIQKDTTYLDRQNLIVVDKDDNIIDPDSVNWSKLNKKYFPYLLKQRQGDDNSLGVLKFNFRNKYAVYLHDTNARWLFSKTNRALSHGCVRVQEWQKLAHYLVRNDTVRYHQDTLRSWINRQEKHIVAGFPKVPIYIRYFTAEGKDGKIRFYDDIYGEDRILRQKYFAQKSIN
jgi:murein L,D-transpeptidase YcbB/YkuD